MYFRKLLFAACCAVSFNGSHVLASSSLSTQTYHTHNSELKPIVAYSGSYQLSAATFLPEWNDHLSVFSSPSGLDFNDDSFSQSRIFKNCVLNGYNRTSCADGFSPDDFCPESHDYFRKCISNTAFCLKNGYLSTCGSGYIPDASQPCSADSSFAKCIINPCTGYDFTLSEAAAPGYVIGDKCLSGSDEKYQRSEASCPGFAYDASNCGSGSQCQELSGNTCQSGSVIKYAECIPCPVTTCSLPQISLETYYCNGALRCLIP